MLRDLAALAARILLSVLFIPNGILKLQNLAGTADYLDSLGLPQAEKLAMATGIFELAGGLCILAGFGTRIVAVLLAGFCLVAGFLGHAGQAGDATVMALHFQSLLKDIALSGGFLALAISGAGSMSLGAMFRR